MHCITTTGTIVYSIVVILFLNDLIVSRSPTIRHQSTPLTLDGTVLKVSADLVVLGVSLDAKMTFEKHRSYPELQFRGLVL